MTFPVSDFNRVWVRGRIVDLTAMALSRSEYGLARDVIFTPDVRPPVLLSAATGHIIAAGPFAVRPQANNGYFQIEVPCTDDPDINPTGWTYTVREPTGRVYSIVVPVNTPVLVDPDDPLNGQRVIDLVDVVPVPEPGDGEAQLIAGRGIASVVIDENDHLIITYTDNSMVDAGAIEVIGDHGELLGLGDDDHPQYLNNARGDVRYAAAGHSHAYQPADGDLTAIAALGANDDDLIQRKGGSWTNRSIAQLKADLALTYAELTGTIPTAALPPLAITDTFVVASEAAMLALTAQRGDVAIREDNGISYILASDSPGTLADWKILGGAGGGVTSVAGKTGVVTLVKADVGLANVDNTADTAKPVSTAQQAAIDAAKLITTSTYTASATLVSGDAGKAVEMNLTTANTLTIPPNSAVAFPIGTVVEVFQRGTGQTTITPGAGVTLRAPNGAKLASQYASASLRKRATDEWVLAGDVVV